MPETLFTGVRTVHLIKWDADLEHITVVIGNIVVGEITPSEADEIRIGVYTKARALGAR